MRDDAAAVQAAIEGGLRSCDALLTSGGVSVGDYDYVKAVLDRLGDMRWMQVAIKPAKPLAFGMLSGEVRSGGRWFQAAFNSAVSGLRVGAGALVPLLAHRDSGVGVGAAADLWPVARSCRAVQR